MTSLGIRERAVQPETYKGFRLVPARGRVYGIPCALRPDDDVSRERLLTHPATVSASSWDEATALIDAQDEGRAEPERLGSYEGYDLVRHDGSLFGVPRSAGSVDLSLEEDRRRAGVIEGETPEEVCDRVSAVRDAVPVEFAGWLPVYEFSGNCGQHPQFTHTADPPPGYRFTRSSPTPRRGPSAWDRCGRVLGKAALAALGALAALARLLGALVRGGPGGSPRAGLRAFACLTWQFFAFLRAGARVVPTLRFLRSRHFRSQVLLADQRGLVFLTSMPYTYNQGPWVVEIEDPTTLFYPMVRNGNTAHLNLSESPYFPIVKALLESDRCKGVLTHMRSTARMVPALFGSDVIARKVFYTPLGVPVPRRRQRHDRGASDEVHLLFINSWCQVPENFYVRGGLDVLEAFAVLHERYPQLRLTLRTRLPPLDDHYHRIIERGWVRVIDRFLSAEEMADLHARSHVFLLPAARVHIVSLLQAMSYGLAVVASDGWGIGEYVTHERNGLIVEGRYGKASWADEAAGMLREDYGPMRTPDPHVTAGLVEAVSRLVEDRRLRRRLGRTARRDVETTYNLGRWNAGLKEALDRALSPAEREAWRPS
jgi:glycosyltransferase involved in cell wall biosynthesis